MRRLFPHFICWFVILNMSSVSRAQVSHKKTIAVIDLATRGATSQAEVGTLTDRLRSMRCEPRHSLWLNGGKWMAGFYNDNDSKVYLVFQNQSSGTTFECYSFSLDDYDNSSAWTNEGVVFNTAEVWASVVAEPHSFVWETQEMADARARGSGTRQWRM